MIFLANLIARFLDKTVTKIDQLEEYPFRHKMYPFRHKIGILSAFLGIIEMQPACQLPRILKVRLENRNLSAGFMPKMS